MFIFYACFSHYLSKQFKHVFVDFLHQIQQVEVSINNSTLKILQLCLDLSLYIKKLVLFLHCEFRKHTKMQL